jgi:methionyl-tRNA synthetase
MLIVKQDKIVIEEGEIPPYYCAHCGIYFARKAVNHSNTRVRCPNETCNYQGARGEFEVEYAEICKAVVLVAKT